MARVFLFFLLSALWLPSLSLFFRALFSADARRLSGEVLGDSLAFLVVNSVFLAFLTAVFSLVLGVLVGVGIGAAPRKSARFGVILLAFPLAIPPVLATTPFFTLGQTSDFGVWLCALALSFCYFPLGAVAFLAAQARLPAEEWEAARGFVSAPRAFFGVLRAHFAPFLLAAGGAIGALALWEMAAPDLLSVPTISSEVYRQLNAPDGANGAFRAALSSWPVPFLALLLLAPTAILTRKNAAFSRQNTALSGAKISVSPFVWPLFWLPFAVSPLWTSGRFLGEIESFEAFSTTVLASADALQNTILHSGASATFCTLAALFCCFQLRRYRPFWRRFWLAALLLPGLFSPLVLGVALVEFWNRDEFAWLYDSASGTTIFGLCARFFPLALGLLWLSVQTLGRAPIEAAQNVGASESQTFWHIVLPLLKPAVAGVFALVFALCAGEITITVLTQGPGGEPLSIQIFSFLHAGIASDVASLCLVVAALGGGALGVTSWILARRG